MAEEQATQNVPTPPKILVVEDDASYGTLLQYQLKNEGYTPILVDNGEKGLAKIPEEDPGLVLLDVMLPGKDGRIILDEIKQKYPDLPVVMITAAGSVEMAVECMKRGAYDFLTKPFEFERLYAILRNALQFHALSMRVKNLEGELLQKHGFEQIIAHSPLMRRVLTQSKRAAQSDSDVLILGESGTGKEVLARAIHFNSERRKGPFVAINCGAIPEGLMESELFGHEKGSFTGAVNRRTGCFEQAHGGSLFLDEIGEMRPDMQVRLLRALEQREIRRVGSDKTIKVDVRVISATNQNLPANMENGKFRTDLYYRLAILVLELPTLRERPEDIGPLAQHFLKEAMNDGHTEVDRLTPDAFELLMCYPWPGNVRELRNAIERAVVFEDGPAITITSLPPDLVRRARAAATVPAQAPTAPGPIDPTASTVAFPAINVGTGADRAPLTGAPAGVVPVTAQPPVDSAAALPSAGHRDYQGSGENNETAGDEIIPMEEEEKKIILRALDITHGNISEAARRLGLHRSTLHRKMARYGLATDEELANDHSGDDE